MFSGSIAALVTPFDQNKVDFRALERIVRWHLEEGTHGLLAAATTGESALLSHEEQRDVITCVVNVVNGKIPVMAGTGAMTPHETIALTQQAQACGADGALVVTPPYIKPTQEGLYVHYKAVHDATDLPLFVYNNPGRAAVEVSNDCLARLSALPRILGVKDATGVLARPTDLRCRTGADFIQLSGDDATTPAFLAQGGVGCISVTANIAPGLCARFHNAWAQNDRESFDQLRDQLHPLHGAMFCETSPGPVKYAMHLLGLCNADMRAPLVPVAAQTKEIVAQAMTQAGLR